MVRTSAGIADEYGSAIDVPAPNTMTVRNCYIADCGSSQKGTVSLSGSAGTPITVVNCVFESNKNVNEGAALYLEGSTNATALVDRCQFINNESGKLGAAIHNDLSYCEIRNSLFIKNTTAFSNDGAAAVYTRYDLRVEHCTFSENLCGLVSGTPAGVYAGAIGFFSSTVSGPVIPNVEVYNSILWGNTSPQINDLTLTASNLTLQGNIIQDYGFGGNLNVDPLLACPSIGNINLAQGSSARNSALSINTTSSVDLYGSPRNQLGSPDMGAVEMSTTSKPVVYVKKGNSFIQSGRSWATAVGELGAVDMSTTAPVTFWISTGEYSNSIDDTPNSLIELCNGCDLIGGFLGNETSEGQIAPNSVSTMSGLNVQFPSNTEWASPVILSISTGGDHQIRNIEFRDGGANFQDLIPGNMTAMGGVAAPVTIVGSNSVDFTNCTFQTNLSNSSAGALHAVSTNQLSLTGCDFFNNSSASNAGAIFVSQTNLSIVSSTFVNNTSGFGGAVSGVFSTTSIGDCEFVSNSTSEGGAGIHFSDNSDLTVLRSVFRFNQAPENLPAINGTLVGEASTAMDIANCLFHDNTGYSTINVSSGALALINSTVAHNVASGAVLRIGGGSTNTLFTLHNSILWNPGVLQRQYLVPTTINLSHSIMQNELFPPDNPNSIINTDPFFISPEDGNFQLASFSPGVNSGSNSIIYPLSDDLAGSPRIADGTVDRGAYERSNGCTPDNSSCFTSMPIALNFELQGSNRCGSAGVDPISSCNVNVGKTVWYSFLAPSDGNAMVVTDNVIPDLGYTNFNMKQTIYTGGCANLVEVACTNEVGANAGETTALSGLTPGQVYFVRLEGVNLQEGFFTLQVTSSEGNNCPGDLNGDLMVNTADLLVLLSQFGTTCSGECSADLDGDGSVSAGDLLQFLSLFGAVCD